MSNTPVKEEETSPLRSEVSSSNSIEDSSLKTQMDLMLEMLVEMKSDMNEVKQDMNEVKQDMNEVKQDMNEVKQDMNEVKQRVTWLEDKKSPGGSPRDKVSSSLFVDVVTTEWDQAGRSITHSTPGPPSPDSKG